MDKINDLLRKYNIKGRSFRKDKSTIIVDDRYVIKKKVKDNSSLYNYLRTRNFDFFPSNYINDEKYEIMEYIDSSDIPNYDKGLEIINIMSLLHSKTTSYEETDIADYKIIYENYKNSLEELQSYFNDLNDYIDAEIYMSPSNYLLVRNISKIYAVLDYCNIELDNWYSLIKDSPKQRKVIINNNIELEHLKRNENSYLISWNKAKKDLPIYDIYNFYKKNYREIEFESIFDMYESRYPLHEEEKKLLFIMLSIPTKIEFTNDEYINCRKVNELLEYIVKTERIISKNYANQE